MARNKRLTAAGNNKLYKSGSTVMKKANKKKVYSTPGGQRW